MIRPLTYAKDLYDDLILNYSDPRTRDWPMVKSPGPMLFLIAAYIVFIKIVGPRMMANREPFELRTAMIVYNAAQALISLCLFTLASIYGWMTRYSLLCQPVVVDHPDEHIMLTLGWCFYLVRFLEFTDTIFFILRKKFQQVSTLHVVHHAIVPVMFWLGVKFMPAGQYTLPAYLNAFVHTFMYIYYMLAALGPRYHRYTFWKEHMTKLQLVQFIVVFIHTVYTMISSCDVPKIFGYMNLFQAILFFAMFFNYYKEAFAKETAASNVRTNISQSHKESNDLLNNDRTDGTLHEYLKNGRSKREEHIHSD